MKLRAVGTDRKAFVKALAEATGETQKYMGPPSFAFTVGPYTVLKNGDIEVDDADADLDLLRDLGAGEVLEEALGDDTERLTISVPMEGHTAATVINFLHIFSSREKLFNRSVGSGHNFLMNKKFLKALDEQAPETLDDFLKLQNEYGGEAANRGLYFTKKKITVGFPFTKDPEKVEAYTKLVELINQMALTQQRVVKEKNFTANEKYAFRVWLVRLGMVGDEYKTARRVLLKNMPGNAAFRTEDQKEAALEKLRAKREEAQGCSEFQEL